MSAHQSPIARTSTRGLARCIVLLLAATSVAAIAADAPMQEDITAVFKAREMSFFYRSSATYYPCHVLQNRVSNILRSVGARDDIQVNASACEGFRTSQEESAFDRWDPLRTSGDRFSSRRDDREQTAHVRIRLMTPVEMTPQVLAEMDKDKSRRELISRVTGNPSASFNDPIVFAARRQTVTLSRKATKLQPEDCELLEQMSRSVFRELNVRVVRGNFTCDPRQPSRIPPQLTVEALLPTGELRPMPEAERKQSAPSVPANTESGTEDETETETGTGPATDTQTAPE